MLITTSQGVFGDNEFNKDFLYIDCNSFHSYTDNGVNVKRYWNTDCSDKQGEYYHLSTLSNDSYVHYDNLTSIGLYTYLRGFMVSQGDWHDDAKMGVVNNSSNNCIRVTNWGTYSWTTYVQKPNYTGLTVTNAISGSGTNEDPYIVYTNTSFTLSSSASLPQSNDSKMSIRYYHGDSSSGDATETSSTKDITSSSSAGVKTQYYGRVRGYYSEGSNNYSSYADNRSVYVQTVFPDYYLAGDSWIGSWSTTDNANKMSINSSDPDYSTIPSKTIQNVSAGDHLFKVSTYNWESSVNCEATIDISGLVSGDTKSCDGSNDKNIKLSLAGTRDVTVAYAGATLYIRTIVPCNAPSVTTTSGASSVTNSGATLKGTVTITSGDCEVTDAGIAYGTSTNPTTPASYGEPTSGEEFEVNISGLSAGERYYYRAYVTTGGVTTYGEEYTFYTNPSELYIKGPLVYDSKWDPYTQDNVGYSHTAGTNTFVFSFNARTGGGGHSDYREYCVSTTDGEGGKIQSFMDGITSGWSFENGSGSNFVASSTIVSTDNTAIDITITYNNSTGQYHMVLAGACSGAPTINNGDIASKNWTKCGNENGRELSITASGGSGTLTYQWFRNTAASETGATAVTDMVVAAEGGNTYSPSSTDYGTYYYYCVVRSGGACSANKATSSFTGAITIKQTPTVTPAAVTVKQYEPVTLTATNSSVNWSITAHPEGDADEYYLYDDTKSSAMFKGKTGSYTITATSTGSDCTSTSTITVNNDDSEGC